MAPLDAQQNVMLVKYNFFLCTFVRSKVIAFLVKNLPKLNILSVIAIDLVKIFKQTKKPFSSFYKSLTTFLEKNKLLKEFPVLGNFGALWSTTWQLSSENNLNGLGDIKYTNFH